VHLYEIHYKYHFLLTDDMTWIYILEVAPFPSEEEARKYARKAVVNDNLDYLGVLDSGLLAAGYEPQSDYDDKYVEWREREEFTDEEMEEIENLCAREYDITKCTHIVLDGVRKLERVKYGEDEYGVLLYDRVLASSPSNLKMLSHLMKGEDQE